jgi:hypothetical protein
MSDPRDEDLPGGFVNLIEDAVVADPDPPALLVAGQLGRAGRTRVVFQSEDCVVDARTKIWREIAALALSRRPKQDGRPSGRKIMSFRQGLAERNGGTPFGNGFVGQEIVNGVLKIWRECLPVSVLGEHAEEVLIVGVVQDHLDHLSLLVGHQTGRRG